MHSSIRKSRRKERSHTVRQGITAALLILVSFWFGMLIFGLVGKAQFAWQMSHQTQSDAQALSGRQNALEKSITKLNSPRGNEAAIRTAFGVARPGEKVIIVVPPKVPTSIPPQKTWWQNILDWLRI